MTLEGLSGLYSRAQKIITAVEYLFREEQPRIDVDNDRLVVGYLISGQENKESIYIEFKETDDGYFDVKRTKSNFNTSKKYWCSSGQESTYLDVPLSEIGDLVEEIL